MPRTEKTSAKKSNRHHRPGSEAQGYGGPQDSTRDTYDTHRSKNGDHGYDANRQYRSPESGNYGNWEHGEYDEFDPKFDSEHEEPPRKKRTAKQNSKAKKEPKKQMKAAGKTRAPKRAKDLKVKRYSDSDYAVVGDVDEHNDDRRYETDRYNDRYYDDRHMSARQETGPRRFANPREDAYRAQERTRHNFRAESDPHADNYWEQDRNQRRYGAERDTEKDMNYRARNDRLYYNDVDRYGYSSDRGLYGHYHPETYDRNREPDHDRERGLRNSGPNLMSDYGAGEGRGHFSGRDRGPGTAYANEFYEDADNERLREARRNYSYRHNYDETDSSVEDFAPHNTRGISPGFDEVVSRKRRSARSTGTARRNRKHAGKKKAAKRSASSTKKVARNRKTARKPKKSAKRRSPR